MSLLKKKVYSLTSKSNDGMSNNGLKTILGAIMTKNIPTEMEEEDFP